MYHDGQWLCSLTAVTGIGLLEGAELTSHIIHDATELEAKEAAGELSRTIRHHLGTLAHGSRGLAPTTTAG